MFDRDRFVDPGDNTNAITLSGKPGESKVKITSGLSLLPEFNAASTIQAVNKSLGDLHVMTLVDELHEQNKAANNGDMTRAESILTSQAHTLDALFNSLTQRAVRNIGHSLEHTEAYLRLALRAQSQCRATIETLSVVKNPPIAGYAKQVNISGGHQQVNNGCTDPGKHRAGKNKTQPNKLLESNDGERLDFGETTQTCDSDKTLETVGTVNRS